LSERRLRELDEPALAVGEQRAQPLPVGLQPLHLASCVSDDVVRASLGLLAHLRSFGLDDIPPDPLFARKPLAFAFEFGPCSRVLLLHGGAQGGTVLLELLRCRDFVSLELVLFRRCLLEDGCCTSLGLGCRPLGGGASFGSYLLAGACGLEEGRADRLLGGGLLGDGRS